jgi:hypothetical protein
MPLPLPLWEKVILFWAFLHVTGPLLVRATFRFAAKVEPVKVPLEAVPAAVRAAIDRWSTQIQALGFSSVGVYSMGALASNTQSFLAYFVNRSAGDFANVSVVESSKGTKSYFEFSSSFTSGLTLDTNTNQIVSIGSTPRDILIFRFPRIAAPAQLYQIHRALIQKHAAFLRPQLPPEGQEATRIVQQLGRYGPCQAQAGYMHMAPGGTHYRLTWKGALWMTWRSIWPTSLIRRTLFQMRMQKELSSLEESGVLGIRTA